jgi:hypothetical protein
MLCINYGIKRLSKLCKCILAPPVILTISMHLQCSCMPAKVYYEPSRRFGTRNVLTENTGMDLLGGGRMREGGGHPLALVLGGAGMGAIFHDKAKHY